MIWGDFLLLSLYFPILSVSINYLFFLQKKVFFPKKEVSKQIGKTFLGGSSLQLCITFKSP